MDHNVFVIVYGDNKVIVTDVKSEATECVIKLVTALTPFKVAVYNTVNDYIVRM